MLNLDNNAGKLAAKTLVMTPQQQMPISLFELENENGDQKDSMLPLSNILESQSQTLSHRHYFDHQGDGFKAYTIDVEEEL